MTTEVKENSDSGMVQFAVRIIMRAKTFSFCTFTNLTTYGCTFQYPL